MVKFNCLSAMRIGESPKKRALNSETFKDDNQFSVRNVTEGFSNTRVVDDFPPKLLHFSQSLPQELPKYVKRAIKLVKGAPQKTVATLSINYLYYHKNFFHTYKILHISLWTTNLLDGESVTM